MRTSRFGDFSLWTKWKLQVEAAGGSCRSVHPFLGEGSDGSHDALDFVLQLSLLHGTPVHTCLAPAGVRLLPGTLGCTASSWEIFG